jgi:hypothetical protein
MAGINHTAFAVVDRVWRAQGSGRHNVSTSTLLWMMPNKGGMQWNSQNRRQNLGLEMSGPHCLQVRAAQKMCAGSSGGTRRRASSRSSSISYGGGIPSTDPIVAALGFGKGCCGTEMRQKNLYLSLKVG